MNQIIKNTIILFVITLVAGFCLGAVHDVTLEPIAQAQEAAATKTFQEVYPEAASFDAPQELTDAVAAAAESISEWGYGKVTINRIPYHLYFRRELWRQCSDCSRYL